MKFFVQGTSFAVLCQLLAFCAAVPNPASSSQSGTDAVPTPGSMTQGASTVLAVVQSPGTDTTVSFSKFASPAVGKLTQGDSLTCIIEALQEIYSGQTKYGISTHLTNTWSYSGSQQPKNLNCLTMQNQDQSDHILTWGIIVESLRAVALGLSNTTYTSTQFDVYSKDWGHLGFGSLGMQMGEGTVQSA